MSDLTEDPKRCRHPLRPETPSYLPFLASLSSGVRPAARKLEILLSTSNQKGAPSEIAMALRRSPNTLPTSVSFGRFDQNASGHPSGTSRALSSRTASE